MQAQKLEQFYTVVKPAYTTLHDVLRGFSYDRIEELLRAVKAGQYKTLTSAIYDTVAWLGRHPERLRTMTVDELQHIRGVGPKTARFFMLHTRPNQRIAVLDTHILKYLATKAEAGETVPSSTPSSPRVYAWLEKQFLFWADFENVPVAEFDLAIWRASRDTHAGNWRNYLEE